MIKNRLVCILLLITLAAFSCRADGILESLDVHGSFSQGYLYSSGNNYIEDSEDGTFDFREYVLNAQIEPLENLRIGAQVLGREFGAVGNDELTLDWALVDYKLKDCFGVRAGKMRVPHGLYHEARDFDALRTEILLPQGVYMEYMREFWGSIIGGAVYGDIMTDDHGTFSYLFLYGDRQIDKEDGDMARLLSSSGTTIEDYDMNNAFAGSFQWITPLEGLRCGVTYSHMDYDIDGSQSSSFGTSDVNMDVDDNFAIVGSVEYECGPVTLAAEYMEAGHEALATVPGSSAPGFDLSQDFRGYYCSGSYRFNDYLASALGYSKFDVTDVSESSYTDRDQPDYNDYQEDIYVSLRADVTENLIMKLEHHWIAGSAGLFDFENPDGESKHTNLLAAKVSLIF